MQDYELERTEDRTTEPDDSHGLIGIPDTGAPYTFGWAKAKEWVLRSLDHRSITIPWGNVFNKPDFAPSDAQRNVQSDWNEKSSSSDAFILNKPSIGGGSSFDPTRLQGQIDALAERTGDIEEQSITRSYQLSAVASQGGMEEVTSKPASASIAAGYYGAADGTNTLSLSAGDARSGIEFIFRIPDGQSLTLYNFDGLSYADYTNLEQIGSGGGWQYWYIPVSPTESNTPAAFNIKMQVLTSLRYRWDGDLTERAVNKAVGSDVDARLDLLEDRTHDISGHGGRSWSNTVVATQGGMIAVGDSFAPADAGAAAAAFDAATPDTGVNELNIARNDHLSIVYRIPAAGDSTDYRIGHPETATQAGVVDHGTSDGWHYFGTRVTNDTNAQITITFQHNAADYVWEGLIKPDKLIGAGFPFLTREFLNRTGTWETIDRVALNGAHELGQQGSTTFKTSVTVPDNAPQICWMGIAVKPTPRARAPGVNKIVGELTGVIVIPDGRTRVDLPLNIDATVNTSVDLVVATVPGGTIAVALQVPLTWQNFDRLIGWELFVSVRR